MMLMMIFNRFKGNNNYNSNSNSNNNVLDYNIVA